MSDSSGPDTKAQTASARTPFVPLLSVPRRRLAGEEIGRDAGLGVTKKPIKEGEE